MPLLPHLLHLKPSIACPLWLAMHEHCWPKFWPISNLLPSLLYYKRVLPCIINWDCTSSLKLFGSTLILPFCLWLPVRASFTILQCSVTKHTFQATRSATTTQRSHSATCTHFHLVPSDNSIALLGASGEFVGCTRLVPRIQILTWFLVWSSQILVHVPVYQFPIFGCCPCI